MKIIARPRITFWRGVAGVIFLSGLYSTYVRFSGGLGREYGAERPLPLGPVGRL